MKTPNSDFFQPFLHISRPLPNQLAVELMINKLESALAKEAGSMKYRPAAVKTVAHALENLILRHDKPGEWAGYLQHEIERKSDAAQNLLQDVKSWLNYQPGQPVSKALDEALSQVKMEYEIKHLTCPLSDQDFDNVKIALYPAALREFMAQLLGRLTE